MMSRRLRGGRDEKRRGSPAWMLTYADMVTLILAFFVLLYSMSSIDVQKFKLIISSFQNSLGILRGGETFIEEELITPGATEINISQQSTEELELQHIYNDIQEFIQEEQLQGKIHLKIEERGLVIHLMEGAFFDSGQAVLKKDAVELLNELAKKLKNIDKQIRIEGHTDNVPINTEKYPSNWELSVSRAVTVVRFLIEKHGFSPFQLSAVGYSEYRPIVPNTTPSNKALNRRVDIVILKSEASITEAK